MFNLAVLSEGYVNNLIFSLLVLAVAYILSFIAKWSVDFIFARTLLSRTRNIRSLFKNAIDIMVFLIALMVILSRWDINIVPILTGAGILGLAVSFGAQTLVKDVISGIFIVIENQFSVGDRIKIGDYEGEVHQITLRLTVIKDKKDNLIYIPNSQITTVVRLSH
ncbi:MAG: mechanosensitive ion channel [Candidatus Roizmanbacteria bacterium]|nr:MAG: mechanosensitive ion channel [Candidatus Roizmanbacteria bacterium]